MNSIAMWVLVIAAGNAHNQPVISLPVVDLPSCERLQRAVRQGDHRPTQCVQVYLREN
jgi:hypothetical protein